MRDLAFVFDASGQVTVDWSATVVGIHNVKQKLIGNLMTDVGTDEVVPDRGTRLLRAVTGGGVYDLRSAQHALNFAALSAKLTVRANEPPDLPPAEKVQSFTAVFASVTASVLAAQLTLTTADGNSIGGIQPLF